ncbi:CHRD domain-containing protein [Aridibaculum aurantiacum]|uniref:CHRD domain-containing protein n=1 Tax=Aridibaculum aurantiacum TaxID=2810307 RepID=UPI001A969844|nr:CHRD domain-containing protein [Aridibaculum aurantiacum]
MKTSVVLSVIVSSLLVISCNKRNEDYSNLEHEVIKEWRMPMSSAFVVPTLQGRSDSGELILQVRDDRTVIYQYNITQLATNDYIHGGGIYAGDPASNGPLMLDLRGREGTRYSSGILTNLRQSLIDSLINDNVKKYVQVFSKDYPSGVARANITP